MRVPLSWLGELGSGIKKPTGQPKKDDVMSRRLIDAQVAFGVGNYDNAALLLYDYANANANACRDNAVLCHQHVRWLDVAFHAWSSLSPGGCASQPDRKCGHCRFPECGEEPLARWKREICHPVR